MPGVRCICVLEHGVDDPVVAHCATDVVNRARLRLAAWMLSAFRHPGVVQLASVDDGDGSTTLRTRFVGSRTLETTPPMSSVLLAATAAAVAQVIADLHSSGITHGAIEPPHVLVTGPGRPILCGFGRGVLKADSFPDVWAESTRDDVEQLCGMIETLITGLSPLSEVAAARRIGEIRRRRSIRRQVKSIDLVTVNAAELASKFARIAPAHPGRVAARSFRAVTAPPRRDPPRVDRPARAFVDGPADPPATQRLLTPRKSPASDDATLRSEDHVHHMQAAPRIVGSRIVGSRVFQIALFLVGATCVGAGAQAMRGSASSNSTEHAVRPAVSTARSPNCPAARRAATTTAAVESIRAIDIDGDGCIDEVSIAGRQLTVNGSTYSIGKAGDQIYFGDWDGDGISTPALLRPDSGAVFFFNVWPSKGAPLQASATDRVTGATAARVTSKATGRAHLIVQRTSGPDVPVHFRTRSKGATPP